MTKHVNMYPVECFMSDYMKNFHDSRNNIFSHTNPFELSFKAICQLTDFATNAVDQFIREHNETVEFFSSNIFHLENKSTRQSTAIHSSRPAHSKTHRVAVVTGGTGGIGTEICKRFHDEDHTVVATYIAQETEQANEWQALLHDSGYDFEIIECDVTDFEKCKKLARTVNNKFKRVDILVNCAGITRDATLKNMVADDWHAVLDTNLDSVFNVTRNLIESMVRHQYGRIINISSVNGQKGQFGQTNYATAKAGIIGFSKALALEYAEEGITVNTVCPGYVGTSMVEAIRDDIKQDIIGRIPVGRLAKPAEIANAVAFLASESSAYITGSEISINGGLFTGVA